MDETTRIENAPNKPMENRSAKPELSSPTATNMKALDRSQLLDTIAANLFTILKISIFALLLLAIIFIFTKIYTQEGTTILPFETSKNVNLSGVAIADLLTSELIRIQQIHAAKYDDLTLTMNRSSFRAKFSTEQSLGSRELIIPKAEIIEFNMMDIGNIDVGAGSLSLGKLLIAFKNICPGCKPVTTIRGSLQRYGSTIVLVAILESRTIQSWTLRQPIDNNEEQLPEMIRDLAAMIAHDLQQSDVSARSWKGLEYYTEALDAYQQYNLSRNPDFLSLAGNYSLKAIRSEKEYKNPYDLLSLLEFTYIEIGRRNNATEYCDKTIELDLTSPYAWHNKGRVLAYYGKYDEAIQAYNKAIELNPKYAEAWKSKGNALGDRGQYDEAIETYDEVIWIDPNNANAWRNIGLALSYQDKYDEAIQAYNKAIELDPKYATTWDDKGKALYEQGKYDEAIKAYNKAIELDPKYATPWDDKGKALDEQGKYDEAIKAYNKAIELDPKYAGAWNNKGLALDEQGKYDEAIKAYNKAIELDPKLAAPWNNKGKALDEQGKYDEAIQAYNKAIELDPKLAAPWYNKGLALKSLGRTTDAEAAFAKTKELGYTG